MAVDSVIEWLVLAAEDVVEWIVIPLVTAIVAAFALIAGRIYQNKRDSLARCDELKRELHYSVDRLRQELKDCESANSDFNYKMQEKIGAFVERHELMSQLEKHELRIEKLIKSYSKV